MDERSPVERLAIQYCAPRGIPLSRFLENRAVYPGEPEWLPRDTQAALEWQADQNRRCSGCGNPIEECWADEEVAPEYDTTVIRCWACEAVGQEHNNIRANKAAGSGLYVIPRKVDAS